MEIKTLEVKNISHYARGSEETPCYNATVYINGKKAIEVSNDGHGGCDRQDTYPNIEERCLVQQANEWCINKFGQNSFTYQSDGKEEDEGLEMLREMGASLEEASEKEGTVPLEAAPTESTKVEAKPQGLMAKGNM